VTDPDLLFCRACGGSVARRELLAGRALLVEGRAWCPSCAPGMLARRRAFRWGLGGAALAVGGLGGWILGAAMGEAREAASRADRASGAAASAVARIEGAEGRLRSLEAEAKGLSSLLEAEGKALESLRRDGALGRDALEDRLDGVERSLTTLLNAVEVLRKEVAAARGPAGPEPREEEALLALLDDVNAGVRFEAIWRLQRGKGDAARRAAVKGLSDPEDSVRYQSALLARDLRVKEAVPALVVRLSDASAAVRAAAIDALRTLEGTDLQFDPLEPDPARRDEAVLRWKERVRGR